MKSPIKHKRDTAGTHKETVSRGSGLITPPAKKRGRPHKDQSVTTTAGEARSSLGLKDHQVIDAEAAEVTLDN
jgi:hypothetical protein